MFSSFYLSWDWLRFARPSLVGAPWQEISKHLTVFVTDFVLYFVGGSLSLRFGIGFALLAHPFWVIFGKKSATTYRRLFLFCFTCLQVNKFPVSLFLADKKGAGINYKSSLCKAVEPFKSYCSRIYRRQS